MKNILCFGDSLTWGWVPKEEAVPTERYTADKRWTGVLAHNLGADYHLIEEGLSGRTTNIDDPTDVRLNGAAYLPAALASHLPLDLVLVMLGTNDTKSYFNRSPFDIATGMSVLLGQIATSSGGVGTQYPAPHALLLAPPLLAARPNPWFSAVFSGGPGKTAALAPLYEALASFMGASFFDVSSVVKDIGIDGIHFTEANNVDLGHALTPVIRELLE